MKKNESQNFCEKLKFYVDGESNKSEVTLESIAKQLEELNRKLNG